MFEDFVNEIVRAHREVMAALPFNLTDMFSSDKPGMFSGVQQFVTAIDWTSEWTFLYLLLFHFLVYFVVLKFLCRTLWRLVFAFGALSCMILAAGVINEHGRRNVAFFFPATKVNYFDEGGLFISSVYSAPLVLLLFIMQLRLFYDAFKTMTLIKRAEVRAKMKDGKNKQESGRDAAKTTKKDQ